VSRRAHGMPPSILFIYTRHSERLKSKAEGGSEPSFSLVGFDDRHAENLRLDMSNFDDAIKASTSTNIKTFVSEG